MIEAVAGEPADLEVLDDDVGLAGELADEGLPVGLREIDGDGQLAAVAGEVIRRLGRLAAGGVAQVRRPPGAGVVAAARLLDLDDGGAEIREQLRAPWSREDAGEVEDRQVGERAGAQDFSATRTSSSIFLASPKSMRLLSL